MKLSEIGNTLRAIRVIPVKTLGQNFLHDQNLARWMVAQAEVSQGDFVLEIGPGLGAITGPLLSAGAEVLAIEKDRRLVDFLQERYSKEAFQVIHGDALDFDPGELFPRGPVKLLGNLPYYISTPLLFHFLECASPITLMVFMLQKEVAARLTASPRSHEYGVLSLVVQSLCQVDYLRTIPASAFFPQPEVDSAYVRLRPRLPNELPDFRREKFVALVRRGFSQRRKQLGKLLKEERCDWSAAAEKLGLPVTARAEELSLMQWIALTNLIAPPVSPNEGTDLSEAFAVVDAHDKVTGAAPRSEVHGNNLRHRAVHLLIFNRAGELLLQKRSRWKDRHPGVWDSSAAGHVAAGEDYDSTALRELEEELGVRTNLERVAKLPASELTGEEFIWLYRGEHDGPFTPALSEIEALRFFPQPVVTYWAEKRPGDFAPGFLECWRAFCAGENAPRRSAP